MNRLLLSLLIGLTIFLVFLLSGPVKGTDVTFFVAADTHFGGSDALVNNQAQIAAMNGLPGTAFPASIGGTVGVPLGVLVAGDLTNSGPSGEWVSFVANYGLTGNDGLLQYPVCEGSGNHDSDTVRQGIQERHGRLAYSWDWGQVHFVGLDVYPTAAELVWLQQDLAFVGPDRPVVLFHHYGFDSFSLDWWTEAERQAYRDTISGYNIIGIFHGHIHGSWHYTWEGYDCYIPGSVADTNGFSVVHVTDTAMTAAEYYWTMDASGQWTGGYWGWTHTKAITVPAGSPCESPGVGGGPNRRYVNAGAPIGGNGQSWSAAYRDLQDALTDASNPGLSVGEIWVAAGTYTPDRATGDRCAAFRLVGNVGIYGGFVGGESSLDQRDPDVNVTVLSGDLNDDDGPEFANNAENSYHVVTACGVDGSAVLDGFTITAGNADGFATDARGGGLWIRSGNPMVSRCTFSGNAGFFGGAACNDNGNPTFADCRFVQNAASGDAGAAGGGLFNFQGNPSLTACSFSDNTAVDKGGGLCGLLGSMALTGCTFERNSAGVGGGVYAQEEQVAVTGGRFTQNTAVNQGGGICNSYGDGMETVECTFTRNTAAHGGGISNDNADLTADHCTWEGNSATADGGGIYNMLSPATVTNCLFVGNSATNGGGMFSYMMGGTNSHVQATNCTFSGNVAFINGVAQGGGGLYVSGASSILANCIFWGNWDPLGTNWSAQIRRGVLGTITATYTCVQDADPNDGIIYSGTGNIDDDPLFVRNPDPGTDGAWNGVDDDFGDLRLASGSPCIDAGDNAPVTWLWELSGLLRRAEDLARADTGNGSPPIVDMGVFERTVPADIDGDGDVDGIDFLTFSNCYNGSNRSPLPACENPNSDLERDGDVDGFDFLTFANCYNGSNHPPLCP